MTDRFSFTPDWELGELSEVERRLCEAFSRGHILDLRAGDWNEKNLERGEAWGVERHVRAEVIAALLLSEVKPAPGKVAALRLIGAKVTGQLSLAYAEIAFPLMLENCWLEESICLDEAVTRSIDLTDSTVPVINANDTKIKGHLYLDRCQTQSLALTDARIAGQLSLNGAHLINPGGDAVNADRLAVEGGMFCNAGFQAEGCIRLPGARISGQLSLDDAHLINPLGDALNADGAIIEGGMLCTGGFQTEGCIRLLGARISGELSLADAHLSNPGNVAFHADRLVVEGNFLCGKESRIEGEIRLLGARISGQLGFIGTQISNPGGSALSADGLVVLGSATFREGFQAEGETRLHGVRVSGQFSLTHARLINPDGSALHADGLIVESSMIFGEEFRAEGEIRFLGARISGQLGFIGAHAANPGGEAISADGLFVDGDMFCVDGFQADGEVRLIGGRISGQLCFKGARLVNAGGSALRCEHIRAASLELTQGFNADGVVNLAGARVGTLIDDPINWPLCIDINELVYDDLEPDLPSRKRLLWLQRQGKEYRAQPYEQLAAYYRRQGHDEDARRVLLAKQRHYRASRRWYARIWGFLLDGMVGYGYRPGRAALWVLGLLAAGSVYFTYHQPQPIKAGESPHFQPVLYTADVLLPIVNLGQESAFKPQGLAQWVASVLILLGWVFATALIAGITRVLTRS